MISKIALLNALVRLADKFDREGEEKSADIVEEVMKKVLAMEDEEAVPISIGIEDDEMDELEAVLESLRLSLE
jgi:hypothetical protein